MRISNIRIKNYRSIKDTGDLNIDKLFALIGKNNVGKSAILKCIRLCLEPDSIKIEEEDFHKNIKDNIEISVSINFIDTGKYKPFKDKDRIKLLISSEDLSQQYYLNGETITKKDIKKLPEPLVIPDIRDPENEATGGSKSFLNKIFKIFSKQGDEENLKKENEYRVNLEKMQKERFKNVSDILTEKIQTILETEKMSISVSPKADFSKLFFYRSKLLDKNLKEEMSNGVDILSCGTGLQSMFILALLQSYAEIAGTNDSILLIEEPEVYLHPEFQRKMFSILRKIASYNQVIYTTHSPIMISDLWLDRSIKLVALENGESKIKDMNVEEVINELGIKYDDILDVKKVIFVEGKEDRKIFNAITKKILKPDLDYRRVVNFIPTDNWRSLHLYACLRILLSEFVKPNYCCIGDNDGLEPKKRQKQILSKIEKEIKKFKNPVSEIKYIKDKIVILDEYSVESYFLDENLLNEVFPKIDKKDLKYMLDLYKEKYKEKKKELNETDFQKIFKPKLLFSRKNTPEEYKSFFDKKFLKTRKLLSEECERICKKGNSPFVYIVENIDIYSSDKLTRLIDTIEKTLPDGLIRDKK